MLGMHYPNNVACWSHGSLLFVQVGRVIKTVLRHQDGNAHGHVQACLDVLAEVIT
jgi:hypothetical protein